MIIVIISNKFSGEFWLTEMVYFLFHCCNLVCLGGVPNMRWINCAFDHYCSYRMVIVGNIVPIIKELQNMKDKVALTQAFVAKFQHKAIMKYQRPIYHWCILTYIVSIDSSSSIRGSVMLQSTPSISNSHLTKWVSAVVFQVLISLVSWIHLFKWNRCYALAYSMARIAW